MGRRALRNACLGFLTELGQSALAYQQYQGADNMTDAMAALTCLAQLDCAERDKALEAFYGAVEGRAPRRGQVARKCKPVLGCRTRSGGCAGCCRTRRSI